jgi:preprotein translocase subunit SecY
MPFRLFRLVMGLAMGALAVYLVATGAEGVVDYVRGTGAQTLPIHDVLGIVVGLLVIAAFYYALVAESPIHRSMENIFSIPELLRKLGFTLLLLAIYRVGFHIPLPGLNELQLEQFMEGQQQGPFGQVFQYYQMFTGGSLQKSTLFGLGIMPYISASIILTLMTAVIPALERLQREGPAGQRKIREYTRYLTVLLCLFQAVVWMTYMRKNGLLYAEYQNSIRIYLTGVAGLTAGTIFLMWLGEQIDEYGIGNGISLLIMAGIVVRMPGAIIRLRDQFRPMLLGEQPGQIGVLEVVFLVCSFVFVVAGAILITQGQRRIPIQQAKHTRGRRVYGGQRQYLPLRVNHGGVLPIIFASSLMILPKVATGWANTTWQNSWTRALDNAFTNGSYVYTVLYIGLIFFFAFFWTTVQFRPREMADQLRDYGTFIPGLRPGRRTAEFLERVMERITYCGAAFLAVIAVIPTVVSAWLDIPFGISAFLGGTGLLIVVSVTLDLVQRIEANLVMRNYGGFLGTTRIKGAFR